VSLSRTSSPAALRKGRFEARGCHFGRDLVAVRDSYDVVMLVSKKTEGERLSLLIWRDGKTFTKTTRLRHDPVDRRRANCGYCRHGREGAARTAEAAEPSATLPFVQITALP